MTQVLEANFGVVNGGRRELDCLLREVLLAGGLRPVGLLKSLDEGVEDEEEGGRVGIVRVLRLELFRHLAPGFSAKDLLAGDPAVLVHQAEPALDDLEGHTKIPVRDRKQMESFVPQKATGEEGPRRNAREELVGTLQLLLLTVAGFLGLLPEAFVLLRILGSVRTVDHGLAVEVSDAANQ